MGKLYPAEQVEAREAIAAIIDPRRWQLYVWARENSETPYDISDVLLKADAILTIHPVKQSLTTEVADGWQDIANPPPRNMAVLVYYGAVKWRTSDGVPASLGPIREQVERTDVGFYQDGCWHQSGTGHDMFEELEFPEHLPTKWRPLPAPPGQQSDDRTIEHSSIVAERVREACAKVAENTPSQYILNPAEGGMKALIASAIRSLDITRMDSDG